MFFFQKNMMTLCRFLEEGEKLCDKSDFSMAASGSESFVTCRRTFTSAENFADNEDDPLCFTVFGLFYVIHIVELSVIAFPF